MKAKVIIERGTDGSFSAHLATKTLPFGLIGEGKTAQETREDFLGGYEDMRDYYNETGKEFPEVEFACGQTLAGFVLLVLALLTINH